MTIYYKATRPDGTDFYSGTILYEVGKTVRPKKHSSPSICGPGVLHAADVPAMTLVGGSWPCRLFEVAGKPFVGFDAEHPHKAGFKQLRVVREVDAHLALGPNGVEVARLIESCRSITPEQAKNLRAAWDAARAAAWDAARAAARDAARDAAWAAARAAAGAAAGAAARDAVRAAVRDAARALVVRDLITPEQFDTLTGPWVSVMGRTWEA